jgi:hypothetical protein
MVSLIVKNTSKDTETRKTGFYKSINIANGDSTSFQILLVGTNISLMSNVKCRDQHQFLSPVMIRTFSLGLELFLHQH